MTDQTPAEMAGGEMIEHKSGDTGTMTAVARTRYEMEAAIVLAKQHPRNEAQAIEKLKRSCSRVGFALDAEFDFQRGGTDVTGPSVRFAREAARCWGNIRYGVHIYSSDGEQVHIRGYAFDAEWGAFSEFEDRFAKLVERAGSNWIVPNERELRELVNKRGAILVRNSILTLLPPDQVEDCITVTRSTIHKWGGEALKADRKGSIQLMQKAFKKIGVPAEKLDEWLGHEIRQITTEEYVKLKRVYKGIEEGQTSVAEHFGDKRPAATSGTIDPDAGMQPKATTKPKDPGQAEAEANIERLRAEKQNGEGEGHQLRAAPGAVAPPPEPSKDGEGGGRPGAGDPEAMHNAAAPPEPSEDSQRTPGGANAATGSEVEPPPPGEAPEIRQGGTANGNQTVDATDDHPGCEACGAPLTGEETEWLEALCVKCYRQKVDRDKAAASGAPEVAGQGQLLPDGMAKKPDRLLPPE